MTEQLPSIDNMDYFTNRALANKKGEKTGKILMWREKGDPEFNVKMKCPECGATQESRRSFERRPYRVKCDGCGLLVAVSKLKADKE